MYGEPKDKRKFIPPAALSIKKIKDAVSKNDTFLKFTEGLDRRDDKVLMSGFKSYNLDVG